MKDKELRQLNDPDERVNQMRSKLRNQNFRITPQRLAVLQILAAGQEHPSVEQIYDQVKVEFPMTSLATVYKTVSLLKELHEVLELGFPDGSNRYDGNRPAPHPHLICTQCRKITDPELVSLEQTGDQLSQKTGYEILYHRLDFFGLCPECQASR
jgi:Fur family transcriptional regulator, peroxide stress response regulator